MFLEKLGLHLHSAVTSFHFKTKSIPASGEEKEEKFEQKVQGSDPN